MNAIKMSTMNQMEEFKTVYVPKIFVVCDQADTASVWGYVLRQQGLIVIIETRVANAVEHWSNEITDMVVIDVDVDHHDPMNIYKSFRDVSVAPILLLFPTHHEKRILEAYAAGVDEVVVKPISPAIFYAKVLAWVRRSWTVPVAGLDLIRAGKHRLDPSRRCLIDVDGKEVKLTTLEFRLLHLLMARPGQIFSTETLVQSIWGEYGSGDHILLKNVVYRLRKKIEADPSRPVLLQTWPGGYSFHD